MVQQMKVIIIVIIIIININIFILILTMTPVVDVLVPKVLRLTSSKVINHIVMVTADGDLVIKSVFIFLYQPYHHHQHVPKHHQHQN